jgi:formate dehydrogenase iron-sulfur subunit
VGIDRRGFFKLALTAGGGALLSRPGGVRAAETARADPERWGMLVDTTLCVGCRLCEWACKKQNQLPHGSIFSFGDASVFDRLRRPDAVSYTVVNRFPAGGKSKSPVYVKVQCMHCEEAACVSACLVGAMRKTREGPVLYDPSKCMGCRYCMVACPFQIPAYEYTNAFTPAVRKCTFCFERVVREHDFPACCKVCPREALTFGRRADLLAAARERIAKAPDRYLPRIYGEREVGGTDWLYLTGASFESLGFPALGDRPVTRVTESVQHAVFKYGLPPLALYALLGGLMWTLRKRGTES